MVELIVGEKGKGKTKVMLDRAASDLSASTGNIIYLDKDLKHMHSLDHNIRLIDINEYGIENTDQFTGFINGIISQNNDIEEIILDSYLTIAYLDTDEGLVHNVERLEKMSEQFGVKFLVSVSRDKSLLPAEITGKITVSL